MNNLQELSINTLLEEYYPGREIYLNLDGVIGKYRIKNLVSRGDRKVDFIGVPIHFSFSSLPSAKEKNKLVSYEYKKVLMYIVPAEEEVNTWIPSDKEELSLAKIKYDYKIGDSFHLAYGYSYNVDKPIKRYPLLAGEFQKATIIKKEITNKYDVIIDLELESHQVIQIQITESGSTHINSSFYLGLDNPASFYFYYK